MDGLITEGTGFWNKAGQVLGTDHSCLQSKMSACKMLTIYNVTDSEAKEEHQVLQCWSLMCKLLRFESF